MKIQEVLDTQIQRLGKSVRYPFYSIFKTVSEIPNGRLKISVRRDRPAETNQSGIYVWHHPDWGYFYVGIAGADNFTERWNKHIQKLLDKCSSAKQMRNWQSFAQKFAAAGYTIEDLKDITLRFYPRPKSDSPTFKDELRSIETRIVGLLNPACNTEYNPNRPSSTKFPTSKTVTENFADGKKPGRKGLAKRSGVNCKQSVSKLRKVAANSSGEKQRMAHWCANMKSGHKKSNEDLEHREGIDLELKQNKDEVIVVASSQGRQLGYAQFQKIKDNHLIAAFVKVYPEYQGQGIAKVMYNYAKERGFNIVRSYDQTPSGKKFWDKNRGEEEQVWEDDLEERSKSQAQWDLMHAVADNPNVSRTRNIPQWVGQEFAAADAGHDRNALPVRVPKKPKRRS